MKHIECIGANEQFYIKTQTKTIVNCGIILPSLYFVKIAHLPVKNAYKAKSLASAVFDGFLPIGKYSYMAKKLLDGRFCLIAYDKEQITQRIKDAKCNANIWYFAQYAFEQNLLLPNNKAFVLIDDIFVELPKDLAPNTSSFTPRVSQDIFTAFFMYQKPQNIWQSALVASLLVLIFSFGMQSAYYAKLFAQAISAKTSSVDINEEKLHELKNIQTSQYALRDAFEMFGKIAPESKLESMRYASGKLEAVFVSSNPTKLKALLNGYNPQAVVISGNSVSAQFNVK